MRQSSPNLQSAADRMRIEFIVALAAAAALLPSPALAWGKTGHRVVAAIAQTQLSGLAWAHIREILGPGENLVDAANWPDEMRSDPAKYWQKTTPPWHYVTLNGIIYDQAPPEGDALEALDHFRKVLQDPSASLADKQTALRFVVHIVGDLHQPLHVGKCCDRGGNEVKVTYFGKPTNLHSVWDTHARRRRESVVQRACRQARAAHDATATSSIGGTSTRATGSARAGSFAIRSTRRPPTCRSLTRARPNRGRNRRSRPSPISPTATSYKMTPLMEKRLSQGGVRLAAYLNDIFAQPEPIAHPFREIGR